MQIKIGKVPGRTQVLELQQGATIADAVRRAGLDVSGHELRLNGSTTENFNRELSDGAIVLLTPRIKGNADSRYIEVYFKDVEYTMERTATVEDLLEVADWSDNYDYDTEVVARREEGKWIGVKEYDKIIANARYDIVDEDDALIPVVQTSSHNCSCGGSCNHVVNLGETDAQSVSIVVGDFEITINKVR